MLNDVGETCYSIGMDQKVESALNTHRAALAIRLLIRNVVKRGYIICRFVRNRLLESCRKTESNNLQAFAGVSHGAVYLF